MPVRITDVQPVLPVSIVPLRISCIHGHVILRSAAEVKKAIGHTGITLISHAKLNDKEFLRSFLVGRLAYVDKKDLTNTKHHTDLIILKRQYSFKWRLKSWQKK